MKKQGFPKSLHIRKQPAFDHVHQNGSHAADSVLVVLTAANDLKHSRLGLSVSRKVGNAVVRNRWKRLIREAFRKQQNAVPQGFDFVVRPRRGAQPDARAIERSLPRLTRKAAAKL